MSAFLFFIAATGVIAGATGVVTLRSPFYSVLALQVVVYAGAVMVLYVFVVAYVGDSGEPMGARLHGPGPVGSGLRKGGAVLAGCLLTELLIALLGTGLKAVSGYGAGYAPGPRTFGTPAYIGELLLTRFLLAFEAASIL